MSKIMFQTMARNVREIVRFLAAPERCPGCGSWTTNLFYDGRTCSKCVRMVLKSDGVLHIGVHNG